MSTSQQIVTQAFRMLGALDIAEAQPSPMEMSIAIETLTRMIDSWSAQSLNISTVTLVGNVTLGSAIIAGMTTDPRLTLAPGLNVAGTGIPSCRVKSVDSSTQITLTENATATGNAVSLTFTALPFEAKYERGVIALLAVDLAPILGMENVPKLIADMAKDGWSNLTANFMLTPEVVMDRDLLFTSIRRDSGVIVGNG